MHVHVGIPQAMLYHEFGSLWADFFDMYYMMRPKSLIRVSTDSYRRKLPGRLTTFVASLTLRVLLWYQALAVVLIQYVEHHVVNVNRKKNYLRTVLRQILYKCIHYND